MQGREIFTPEKMDVMLDRQIRRLENEWIDNEIAKLEETTDNVREEISADQEHLKGRTLDEVRS